MQKKYKLDLVFNDDFKSRINAYYLEGKNESIELLPNFSKINILIGANNSGKSRFMRYFMVQNKILLIKEYNSFIYDIDAYNLNIGNLKKRIEDFISTVENTHYISGGDSEKEKARFLGSNTPESLSLENYDSILNIISGNTDKIYNLIKIDFIKDNADNSFNRIHHGRVFEILKILRNIIFPLYELHTRFYNLVMRRISKLIEIFILIPSINITALQIQLIYLQEWGFIGKYLIPEILKRK
jgi:hypothetical protein